MAPAAGQLTGRERARIPLAPFQSKGVGYERRRIMIDKEKLHRLIDELPERELLPAERFLEYLRDRGVDPLLKALANAPIDDEPETEEERAAVEEAKAEIARGEVLTWDEVEAHMEDLARQEVARNRKRKRAS